MKTYLEETVARFESCDTTSGYPLRELVGCILWACNVHGGDLMRAKAEVERLGGRQEGEADRGGSEG